MAMTLKATWQAVEDYQTLFVNRRAYTMQSLRPHPETGRHYYFRPSKKGTDIPQMLTDETIRQHLEGKITIGLYAINPSTQRCKWVAIDADYKNAMEDLLKLQYYLGQDRVMSSTEVPDPPDTGPKRRCFEAPLRRRIETARTGLYRLA